MSRENISIEDLLCLLDEVEPGPNRRGYEILIAQLRQGPSGEVYQKIEQMAADAGTDRQLIGWEREAVLHHQTIDRLLAADGWQHPAEVVDFDTALELDYQALLNICAARQRRGEGDAAQLRRVEQALERARDATTLSAD